jgi:defect-in-organelle-trafficking protein DotD
MNIFRTLGVVSLVVSVVAGCKSAPVNKDDDVANRLIADKMAVAADAQRQYVALVAADKQVLDRKQASIETDQVDVDFIGIPQELLQTFAFRYGYKFIESGKQTASPLRVVNVHVKKTAPVELLRTVGYQIDNAADVILDKDAKAIRLVYKNLPSKSE